MEKIHIIGHELISTIALASLVREMRKNVVVVNPSFEQLNSVKVKPFEIAEMPRLCVDDRLLVSKYRKGHSPHRLSATQQRRARQRKNKIQAKSRRKNKKP